MDIQFATDRLRRICNSEASRRKEWGERRAKIVGRRLDDLRDAETLEDMRHIPGDCHIYKHREDHTLTLDLDGGWRLFFRPSNDPVPLREDNRSLDWSKVTAVTITEVADRHE